MSEYPNYPHCKIRPGYNISMKARYRRHSN